MFGKKKEKEATHKHFWVRKDTKFIGIYNRKPYAVEKGYFQKYICADCGFEEDRKEENWGTWEYDPSHWDENDVPK